MKRTYSIGLFVGIFLLIILSVISYFIYIKQLEEQPEVTEQTRIHETKVDDSGYYIKEADGYVIVYKADQKTVFEYTTILIDELPEQIKEKVNKGMKVNSASQVYSFLENYSS